MQVALDEGAITAGAMVEFVDQEDVGVDGANDPGDLGDLRIVIPVPKRRGQLSSSVARLIDALKVAVTNECGRRRTGPRRMVATIPASKRDM